MTGWVNLRPPDPPPGSILRCTNCHEPVETYQAPAGWIDPATYTCIECLGGDPHERDDTGAADEVDPDEPTVGTKPKPYDPATAEIPY